MVCFNPSFLGTDQETAGFSGCDVTGTFLRMIVSLVRFGRLRGHKSAPFFGNYIQWFPNGQGFLAKTGLAF